MKYLCILLITLLFFTTSNAQIVNIPDANFKDALVNTNCVDTNGDDIADSDADLNNDGEIQESEAEAVLWLRVVSSNIASLEGIQSFYNIELLRCYDNQLTSIDLTQNINLEWLECYNNQLVSLNTSQNPNLDFLWCSSNQLTSLDVSLNSNLLQLWCSSNLLTSLDVTQNTNLEILGCFNNQMTSLDVTQNSNIVRLSCNGNQITTLDVTQNINLEWLECYDNQITNLDFSQNQFLERFYCNDNQLITLDISLNTNVKWLRCDSNQLTSLNINNGNNTILDSFLAFNNPNLYCIQVDDVEYANNQSGWDKDSWAIYGEDCTLGIEEKTTINFNILPNPVLDILNIETQEKIKAINIYSLNGSLLKKGSKSLVDVSDLVSGLYFVQVIIDGKTVIKKFIKN